MEAALAGDPELLARIKEHEGYRRFCYECTMGGITVGYGTLIEAGGHGIPEYIAELLLRDYLQTIESRLKAHGWFMRLNEARQHCIMEMAYQMGVEGVLGFQNMIAALERGDWESCETEALDSRWAKQTPARAGDVASRLRAG